MIGIVDYGVGNLFSLKSSLKFLGLEYVVSGAEEVLGSCDRIILPGVGAFGDARGILKECGLDKFLKEEAASGKPLLGICLGMQLLLQGSEEFGSHEGLGLINGRACPLKGDIDPALKVPHMGWNSLEFRKPSPLFKYLSGGEYVYFVHSYYAKNCAENVTSVCSYGGAYLTASAEKENVYGTQFHPEKSGATGLKILKAFSELR